MLRAAKGISLEDNQQNSHTANKVTANNVPIIQNHMILRTILRCPCSRFELDDIQQIALESREEI